MASAKRINDTLYNLMNSEGIMVTYTKVSNYHDGTPMDDDKVGGTFYKKKGTEYFRKNLANRNFINVREDCGAKGDGVSDDTSKIQLAIDYIDSLKGGTVYVPAVDIKAGKFYNTTKPIYIRDNMIVRGDGRGSLIKNTTLASTPTGINFTFYMGNYAANSYAQTVKYNLNSIVAGTNKVTMSNAAEAANIEKGSLVLIESTETINGAGDFPRPYHAYINRVLERNATTGQIELEDPVVTEIVNAKIGKVGAFVPGATREGKDEIGQMGYMVQNSVLQDIAFESVARNTSARLGMYKCTWQNVYLKGREGIYGNGFSHFTAKNIFMSFSEKVIEMAMYSHDSIVDNLHADWYDTGEGPSTEPLLKLGEFQRRCIFNNFVLNAGESPRANVMSFGNSIDNRVTNFNVTGLTLKNSLILLKGGTGIVTTGNIISNGIITFRDATRCIWLNPQGVEGTLYGNVISDVVFKGSVALPFGSTIGGNDNMIRNCHFPSNSFGSDAICSNNIVTGNYVADGFDPNINGVAFANNTTLASNRRFSTKLWNYPNVIVTSTTADNSIANVSVPANSLRIRSGLTVRYSGTVTGVNGTKTIRLNVFGSNVDLVFQAAETGPFLVNVFMSPTSPAALVVSGTVAGVATAVKRLRIVSLDLTNSSYSIDFRAWVQNSLDSITVNETLCIPSAIGHAC